MPANFVQMSAAGYSAPIAVTHDKDAHPIILPPGMQANISAGGSATFNVLFSCMPISQLGPTAATGVWNVFDGASSLTANANFTLGAKITAVALQVTSWTSGTVTLAVVQ